MKIFFDIVDLIADQIKHHHIGMTSGTSNRQATNRAHMLLELGNGTPINGPVSRIVCARRNFIRQQTSVSRDKKF